MITARLRLPGLAETVLEIPEMAGRPDALDLLDAAIARIDGRDWRAVLEAARGAGGGGGRVDTPNQGPARAPGTASAALAPPAGGRDTPGSGVRATSRDALHRMRASGRLTRQQAALVEFLKAHPGRDWTRAELAEGIGWRVNVICGRVNELLAEPFPMLCEVARRRCSITGESAMALRLK